MSIKYNNWKGLVAIISNHEKEKCIYVYCTICSSCHKLHWLKVK